MHPFFQIALTIATIFVLSSYSTAQSQKNIATKIRTGVADVASPQKSSPAFAEVLLRKTELAADLESLFVEYTEDYPMVKETRVQLELINKESDRLLAVKSADAAKLTAALGKLIVRKVELQGELWKLQQQFGDAHPDVKRARRKVEIFENAIKEILG